MKVPVKRREPHNPNPHNFRDGEMLPIVGGPLSGGLAAVKLFLGVPSCGFKNNGTFYVLNKEKRQWELEEK